MSKHTPGPWKIDTEWLFEDQPMWRSVVSEWDSENRRMSVSGHIGEANANLIAAAPDLLDALETLLNLNDNHSSFGGEIHRDRIDRALDNARAALEKARGEK